MSARGPSLWQLGEDTRGFMPVMALYRRGDAVVIELSPGQSAAAPRIADKLSDRYATKVITGLGYGDGVEVRDLPKP